MMKVHRYGIHKGEEPGVHGNDRAGMVVFAGCHLRCSFCYTPEAAFQAQGDVLDLERVFEFLRLKGAANLNLITPSHVWSEIRAPLSRFRERHPELPVILKVGGYEGVRLAREFAELADIVVMDFKVFHETSALAVNLPKNYAKVARRFLETFMEKRPTEVAADGTIVSGAVVRTLWLPMVANEAQPIGETLAEVGFDGAWNLMRFFIDPVGHRLQIAPDSWANGLVEKHSESSFEIWKDGRKVSRPALERVS